MEEFVSVYLKPFDERFDFFSRARAIRPAAVGSGEPRSLDDTFESEATKKGHVGPSKRLFSVNALTFRDLLVTVEVNQLLPLFHA